MITTSINRINMIHQHDRLSREMFNVGSTVRILGFTVEGVMGNLDSNTDTDTDNAREGNLGGRWGVGDQMSSTFNIHDFNRNILNLQFTYTLSDSDCD